MVYVQCFLGAYDNGSIFGCVWKSGAGSEKKIALLRVEAHNSIYDFWVIEEGVDSSGKIWTCTINR